MERTKVNSVVNNTAKAPKNQGFLEKWFQSGHSFSSAARYDRFDNSPCCIGNTGSRHIPGKGGELTLFYFKASRTILQDFYTFFSEEVAKLSGKG